MILQSDDTSHNKTPVLYIDNDQVFLEYAMNFFAKKLEIRFFTVTDETLALENLQANPFSLIIFAKAGGLEFFKKCQSQYLSHPFILVSHENDAEEAYQLGIDYFLTKKESPAELFNELQFIIQQIADIKAAKNDFETLLSKDEQYQILVENIDAGIGIVDTNERFIYANPACAIIFDTTSDELIGKSLSEYVSAVSFEKLQYQTSLRRKGIKSKYELEIIRKNKELRQIEIIVTPYFNGKEIECIGIITDITEKKILEKSLHEERLRYQALFSQSNDAIILTNFSTLKIITVNKKAIELFGYDIKEFEGMDIASLVLPEEYDATLNVIHGLVAGKTIPIYQNRFKHKNGSIVYTEVNVALVRDEERKPLHFMSIIRNITDRVNLERILHNQSSELKEFGHIIKHDVTNGLMVINGFLSLSNIQPEIKEKIDAQIKYLDISITNSLSLAEAGLVINTIKQVNLHNIAADVAKAVIPPHINFINNLDLEAYCDEVKIKQVFYNIFQNAIIHGQPTEVKVRNFSTPKHKIIAISNNGIPIPMGMRDIFSSNNTRVDITKRHGQGLTIVNKILKAHNWSLSLNMSTAEETSMFISIPI